MLQPGDKIGMTACSNGQRMEAKEKIDSLIAKLQNMGLEVVCSPYLYAECGAVSGTGRERAQALMHFYEDEEIKMIFDISGGDIANEVLNFLDYKVIRQHPKPFWGYSDLTTIINALYTKTGQEGYLYQIRNLIYDHEEEQTKRFKASVMEGKEDLFKINYKFIQGSSLSGTVVGGNIRCLLKLAGTPFMPDFKDKILFLEAMGGEVPQMTTFLNQLKQMNVFHEVKGILLGTFTKMEREGCQPCIEELVISAVENKEMPIAKTYEIGHGTDAKGLIIGGKLTLRGDL